MVDANQIHMKLIEAGDHKMLQLWRAKKKLCQTIFDVLFAAATSCGRSNCKDKLFNSLLPNKNQE